MDCRLAREGMLGMLKYIVNLFPEFFQENFSYDYAECNEYTNNELIQTLIHSYKEDSSYQRYLIELYDKFKNTFHQQSK